MSIESLCDQDTITVTPQTATTGTSMGVVYADGTASTLRCLVHELTASETQDYQARGIAVTHQIFFSSDPNIDRTDRLTTSDGTKLEVTGAYKEGRPGESLLWIVLGNSKTTRDR